MNRAADCRFKTKIPSSDLVLNATIASKQYYATCPVKLKCRKLRKKIILKELETYFQVILHLQVSDLQQYPNLETFDHDGRK